MREHVHVCIQSVLYTHTHTYILDARLTLVPSQLTVLSQSEALQMLHPGCAQCDSGTEAYMEVTPLQVSCV